MDSAVQKYQALVETVRAGSISAAARKLAYSQSGVSRMVAELERDWGVRLLERGRKGVRLTADGEQVMPFVEAVCEDERRLRERVAEVAGAQSGSIVVGTFSSVATHVLPSVIERFQAAHAQVEFELRMGDYSEIESWVADGLVDLGFLPYPPQVPREDLAREAVLVDELMAVVPQGHELAAKERIRLDDLAREPFILLERGSDNEISPSSSGRASGRRRASPPGTTTPSCPWSRTASGSPSCRGLSSCAARTASSAARSTRPLPASSPRSTARGFSPPRPVRSSTVCSTARARTAAPFKRNNAQVADKRMR